MEIRFSICMFVIILLFVGCSSSNESLESTKEEPQKEVVEQEEALDEEESDEEKQEKEETIEETEQKETNEVEKEVDADPVSYLMDKSNDYIKEVVNDGQVIRMVYSYVGVYEFEVVWDLWETTYDGESHEFVLREDEEGLYTGYPESEYYIDLAYPLEEGKTFDDWGDINTITKINSTVSTKAGEFSNVVEVRTSDNWTIYFAPNIGHVLSVDENGNVVSELVEIISR